MARSLQLSPRELEILQCIFDDLKELTIARRLDMSPHTARTHLKRLHRKLGVANRTKLVVRIFTEYRTLYPNEPAPE